MTDVENLFSLTVILSNTVTEDLFVHQEFIHEILGDVVAKDDTTIKNTTSPLLGSLAQDQNKIHC